MIASVGVASMAQATSMVVAMAMSMDMAFVSMAVRRASDCALFGWAFSFPHRLENYNESEGVL